ncbi:MAG: hypothetical protein HZC39_13715 [Chloroflexi bacterium]|jgi:hypothetical protein|nr:hypothetical protein [Chloroflexota bacterium]MBI5704586.1 hypothetical protein [Chloroflexota bacterium]GER78941.1 conserved hypothetical protein [Candidatus Denitrolinea symbiosum]
MSKRRNPFETSKAAAVHPPSLYDSLRVASPRRRSRQWEKAHLDFKVVYRGVDPKLALRVNTLAAELLVPEGEVARSILEYAMRAYEEGDLDLRPRPNPYRMRMTLHPSSQISRGYPMKSKSRARKSAEPSWRAITSWRNFSPELKKTISALASEEGLNVPVGELVSALLRYGLRAHEAGLLKLEPVEKATVLTLLQGGEE